MATVNFTKEELLADIGKLIGVSEQGLERRLTEKIANAVAASEKRLEGQVISAVNDSEKRLEGKVMSAVNAAEERIVKAVKETFEHSADIVEKIRKRAGRLLIFPVVPRQKLVKRGTAS
jgi:hypothetical protein